MRRLPIFLLLDVSESMVGESLRQMQTGLDGLITTLRQDPYALETVYLGVIAFAGRARTLSPLVDLASFNAPKLPIGSGTSLGAALDHTMATLDKEVVGGSAGQKGDWRPIVFLVTDGRPTDNVEPALARWKAHYEKRATMVAIGVGTSVPLETLGRLTENVFHLKGRTEKDFKTFISWISQSISSQTRSVGLGKDVVGAPFRPMDGIVQLGKDTAANSYPRADEDLVIVPGRCGRTKLPYLIRYEKPQTVDDFIQGAWFGDSWNLVGAYPLDMGYFEWSEPPRGGALQVNSNRLRGTPPCPHCKATDAFVGCGCGQISCMNEGDSQVTCPTCGSTGEVRMVEGGFDVGRALG